MLIYDVGYILLQAAQAIILGFHVLSPILNDGQLWSSSVFLINTTTDAFMNSKP